MEKTALVLGGTVPHIELIRQLKERGYYTILVDYLPNPPAKKYANMHIQESTLDHDIVYQIARKFKADLVIAACIDHANRTACDVLEKLGKHFPYSAQTAKEVTDKCLMKQILKSNNIPTSDFVIVDNADVDINLEYPLVVKPVDSNGNRGIRKVESSVDIKEAIVDAINASKTGTAIVEEYVGGVETSIYSYVLNGEAHIILSNERQVKYDEKTGKMPGYAMIYPCSEVSRLKSKIQDICNNTAKAFRLDNTPLLIQAKIQGDEIKIIELMPRIGGGQSYWNIKKLTGFDIISATIDSFEGIEPNLDYHTPDCITVTNNIYTKSAIFGRVVGGEYLLNNHLVDEFKVLRHEGDVIEEDLSSGNRVCSFVISGNTREQILHRVKEAFDIIKVYDINGKEIKREDIYLH